MKIFMRLVLLTVLCAALAFASHALFYRFTAEWTLPLERNITERRWIVLMESPNFISQFEDAYGLANDSAFAALKTQLEQQNLEKPIKIEAIPRFSRKDARMLPEAVVKDLTAQNIRNFDLTISAKAQTPGVAVKRAEVGMRFAREALITANTIGLIEQMTVHADMRLAETRQQIGETVYELERLERRFAQISEIRERYRTGADEDAQPTAGVSVQVNSAVSPRQQLLELELRRVELREKDIAAREAVVAINAMKTLVETSRAGRPAALPMRKDIEQLLAATRAMLKTSAATPVLVSLRELEFRLESDLTRFVHQPANSSAPMISPPSLLIPAAVTIIGLFGFIALWGLWTYRSRLWKLLARRMAEGSESA
jgi:hypothetical protein